VLVVFSGHLHLDYARVVNGIRYVEINSAAYWWLNNSAARRETYPPEVHKSFRYLTHVAAYRDPIWAVVTLDLDRGELVLEGRRTEWVGPDPWTRGETTTRPREYLHPWISDRQIDLKS
jgi:3',5'-cyclic-AMP phosphodiesterase